MNLKLAEHDGEIFHTYELLEMLLYFKVPYKDTSPMAKRLLHRFGNIRDVFDASTEELCEVAGIGPRCAEYLVKVGNLLDIEVDDGGGDDAREYASEARLAHLFYTLFSENEATTFVVAALDNAHKLLRLEALSDIDLNSGSLNAAYYTSFALKNSAAMIVTASNRRYSAPLPLPADRESVLMISKALSAIDVYYGEHLIFSGNSYSGVLSSVYTSHPKLNSLFKRVNTDGEPKNAEIVNNNCHNSLVLDAFDAVVSTFCKEHREKCELLLSRYGRLSSVLATDYNTLRDTVGERLAAFIRIVASLAKRRVTDCISPKAITSDAELCDYLVASCIPLSRECIFLISYDGCGRVISVDRAGEGTLNSSSALPRNLVEIAMRHSAKRVSVAHNHPYGKSEFSEADISFTRSVYEAFLSLGIELICHYCVSGSGIFAISAPFDNL